MRRLASGGAADENLARMKLLPRGRWAWIRFGVVMALLIAVGVKFHVYGLAHLATYSPREGDVVFQSLPRGDLVDAIEGITNSPFSHCGGNLNTSRSEIFPHGLRVVGLDGDMV